MSLTIYDESKFIDDPTYEYTYKFNFVPDKFQKYGFQQVDKGDNILVTAHTSSGKTALAIYSIIHHIKYNNKTIYIVPIKSLGNEKYKEMTELLNEFNKINNTDYTVGLITGDIKIYNPVTNIIFIMTAEILRNALYKNNNQFKKDEEFVFTNNVSCVIIDEVHFMSDNQRGHIWQEIIILLDPKIQLIMLSATVGNAIDFANWIGNIKQKPIDLISTTHRVVPLEHYIYMENNLYSIMNNEISFNLMKYNEAKQIYNKIKEEKKNKLHGLDFTPLKELVNYLRQNDLLQTIIFSFSKNQCEIFAESIIQSFTTEDEIIEIDKLIDSYIQKYPEYHQLTQFINLKSMIRRGIAYHHSGLLPILKELVEILYKQGYIKIIFGTETLAIGVNLPSQSCVFTSLQKHTDVFRYLNTNEYTQMCGRSGRRGKNKGHVIILPLYSFPPENE